MTSKEIKTKITDRYERCKAYVAEHPVRTAFVAFTAGVGGYGIYKLCKAPQRKAFNMVNRNIVSQRQYAQTITNPCTTMAEFNTREYCWHEESHVVRGHQRHLSDGRIIPVSSYTKVTGGKF